MKKLLCLILAVFLIFSICSCGNKETSVYGPFVMIDGNLSLEGVSMGDDFNDTKAVIESEYPGITETHTSSGNRSLEVLMDTAVETRGIQYNNLSYTAGLGDNVITMLEMGFQHEDVDDSILNDTEKLKKTIDDFFAPYKAQASEMENVLVTGLPSSEYRIDENGNREEMVFYYDGNEIYTMVFVDGHSVKVSSREEASKTEGAVILEIRLYAGSLTQSDIDFYLNDNGQTYMGGLYVHVSVLPAEMLI